MTLHEAIAAAGPPLRVYLAGADGESYDPRSTDDIYAVFSSVSLPTATSKTSAEVYGVVPAGEIVVRTVTLNFGNPENDAFQGISEAEMRNWLGEPAFKYRCAWSDDGPEGFLSQCADEQGTVEMWVYPEACARVFFDLVDRSRPRVWLIELTEEIESHAPAVCGDLEQRDGG
jgi:hypothetical protein